MEKLPSPAFGESGDQVYANGDWPANVVSISCFESLATHFQGRIARELRENAIYSGAKSPHRSSPQNEWRSVQSDENFAPEIEANQSIRLPHFVNSSGNS